MATGSHELGQLLPVDGINIATVCAGVRYKNRRDLVLFELAEGTRTTAVFTLNAFCAAPVTLARHHIASAKGDIRYLLVNTGNANAGTGPQGMKDAETCCHAVAGLTGVADHQVLPFSTGVIGERLPAERIVAALPEARQSLVADNWLAAASGIMTTDTRPKGISTVVEHQGKRITLTGITKGAGMIKPNMATMLAFVGTDADIELPLLQSLLQSAVTYSFNRITVDGDTSTNDCCTLSATGKSGVKVSEADPALLDAFTTALHELMIGLAKLIIRDAEGATKFVTVDVRGGGTVQECLQVAYAIAESPLVKTALAASDPNWGRILAAIGRAGVESLDVTKIDIWLGDVQIVEKGGLAPSYTEEQGQRVMNQVDITLTISLGRGDVNEQVWTADLTEEYVRINASYRS
ncbi:bifunctional glutamate N-acetyltransferase/amino-acid acetyltransferase ArgJ [Pseudohongiella sp. SYSU M77423]|uniref:bifunctional glutamate N-acetyltransferase/amino-acid acetyltransferase ArgJ n=1 Tax=unclassified Pseudohongiella TaxID=2629611 RepID=UPI001F00CF90|nr:MULTISPECIES: bifunctional glutamate N-acetyltransferase/amino-acid acetyltransferase ArgJ [unclassified Pseudohongiella]MDH7944563.1 bifunctional glutamate N-acetyltransferase/amino-acid acetyltransferase ArgJ [Pseudohongiella sp. SYSU M77423]